MSFAWLVASGEYSDYSVWCVFEREQDAIDYVRNTNAHSILQQHREYVRSDYTPPNAQYKCVDPIENCPMHGTGWQEIVKDGGGWTCYVEQIQFHPAGEKTFRAYKYVQEAIDRELIRQGG